MTGTGIWNSGLRWGDRAEALEAAAELEELGYTALWIPDTGGDVFGAVERLMAATTTVMIATGILNLWRHTAEETADGHARLTEAHGDRFFVGIGVSHPSIIEGWAKPMAVTAEYLDALDAAPTPLPVSRRALAALGPKMLQLARERTAGTHPYNVTPEHTATARAALGPSGLVLPEQAVVLTTDPDEGRRMGREYISHYIDMPNYRNNFVRMGFGEDDLSGGGSDKFIDALIAWGDEDQIRSRVREHFDAGADHVCIQVLTEVGAMPREAWRQLAPALTR
jgi:probable F420-dependent oxidoreductase